LPGAHDVITDTGGTSTDVALMRSGETRLAREAAVNGYRTKGPMLDIHTLGAGGGSIAFIDTDDLDPARHHRHRRPLPQSAAAAPVSTAAPNRIDQLRSR
jgi:N-methylhydantoinase A/oxoprolinase/acetone carboxylase beta subunit